MPNFDDAVTMHELCKAIRQCGKGVMWKRTPAEFRAHVLLKAKILQREVLSGRYHQMKGTPIKIYRPKKREALAPKFRDRGWQRSMCNNGVYDDLTDRLIPDNVACQRGKGTDLAIRRICTFLRDFYLEYGTDGYAMHLDVQRFFPSTPNRVAKEHLERWVSDPRYWKYLDEIVDNGIDGRSPPTIAADPFGKRGTDLGCQINQLCQVSLLHDIDIEIKKITPYYIRYNDDFLVIVHDKDDCQRIRTLVSRMLREKGLVMTDKGGIQPIRNGILFLQHRFILTDSGKVVVKLPRGKMTSERQALRDMHRLMQEGKRTMEDIKIQYQSFIAYADTADSSPEIRKMDQFYSELFRQRPVYKRKRRYYHACY